MKTMSIYEPAMCCETGICGVSVDPELLRISAVFNKLQKNGVTAARFNLNSAPQAFINNVEINKLINGEGVGALPATVVDGLIVKTKAYPTNEEIAAWLEIPASYLVEENAKVKVTPKKASGGCDCKSGCCYSISTRDISDIMGISKGNLTYHFKKKEDIIEALVLEMHSKYKKPDTPSTLAELNLLFVQGQKVIEENAFYFWHNTQLVQISEKTRDIQNQVIQNQYFTFQKAFERLNRDGMLRDEDYPGQYERIIRVISLTCIYWTPHSKLEQWKEHKDSFLDCVWSMIYPLFTEKG